MPSKDDGIIRSGTRAGHPSERLGGIWIPTPGIRRRHSRTKRFMSARVIGVAHSRNEGAARAVGKSPFFFQAEDGIRDDLVTGVQTCALPISAKRPRDKLLTSCWRLPSAPPIHLRMRSPRRAQLRLPPPSLPRRLRRRSNPPLRKRDRKSTRLNSSHQIISYAVFCLTKKRSTS